MSDVTAAMDHGVEEPQLALPPGFRFHPTDEEVVSHYLTPKVLDHSFSCLVVADVDLNECEPCDLPGRAKMGEKEWYFFVHKSRKYPTGSRTNRATKIGYWKATGRDKEIYRGKDRAAVLVGMKKTLVFYRGRAPRGVKTPWVMHEYRLDGKLPAHLLRSAKDEWAVCRVINKDLVAKNAPQVVAPASAGGMEPSDSMFFIDDLIDLDGLPPLMDSPFGGAAAADDDFTGASSSTSGAAAPPEPGMGYMVKMEQPPPVPAQETQSQYYFSMPAAPNGAGYSQYQAAGNPQAAIRRDCRRPEAPSSSSTPTQLGALLGGEAGMPSLMPSTSRQPSYQDLDELFSEPLMDYSNLWNI